MERGFWKLIVGRWFFFGTAAVGGRRLAASVPQDRQPQFGVLARVVGAQDGLVHLRGLHADRRHRRQGLHRRTRLRPRRGPQIARPRRKGPDLTLLNLTSPNLTLPNLT